VRQLDLTPQLFALFASLVEDACGLHYRIEDKGLFSAKLSAHAEDAGHDSLLDFYYRLRYDDPGGAELHRLVEALLVRETYFFRELPPLRYLAEHHLPAIVARRGRARVWSAACSTGEEPYTLAMLLDRQRLLDRVELVATDLSEIALEQARGGRYGRRSLREGHPADLAQRYLEPTAKGFTVAPKIRDAVTFSTLNLLDDVSRMGICDAILCRNVLIYFRDEQVVRIIERASRQLAPDGLLAVGVSESLMRFGTSLACEEHGSSFFYRAVS
jgi:chemotaxis protein methyltransferase CheR